MTAPRRCFIQGMFLLVTTCAFAVGALGQRTLLPMRAPLLPVGATDLGPVPASQPVNVTVYVAPTADRQAGLVQFLQDVQTPGSAAYRQWLTPSTFQEKFGATGGQLEAIRAFAQENGLTVEGISASGLRVTLSGIVTQVEAAFAPALHRVSIGAKTFVVNTAVPGVPAKLAGSVMAVGGLNTLRGEGSLAVTPYGGGAAAPESDLLSGVSGLADANEARLIAVHSANCLEDVDAATQAAVQLAVRQASAQGITVLADTECGARGSAGFPSVLEDVTAVAVAPGISPATNPAIYELRPLWQEAIGLPADAYRHEPDVTVSSVDALAQTMVAILAKMPAEANGSAPRLGNINATLYELGTAPGLYSQPDGAAADTWEAATGLGLTDLKILWKIYPEGSLADNVAITLGSYYVPAGQALNVTSTVTDTSGQGGGAVPSGSVTFTVDGTTSLGTYQLVNGTYTGNLPNTLSSGSHSINSKYSGDGTYQSITSNTINFTVAAATSTLSATASSGAVVGGTVMVTVTDVSSSGVAPIGTVTVTPQGTNDTSTYTGTLAASGASGTSTAIVSVPATQGGSVTFQATCTSSNSACSTPANATTTIGLGTPTITLTTSPSPPVTGQNTTFTATVAGTTGTKYPVPTGNVSFYNGSTQLPSATLSNGVATMQTSSNITASGTYTATYGGDNNYKTVTATAANTTSAASATTLALTVSPNPPVAGTTTTFTATLGYTLTNGATPTGTINFMQDGAPIGSVPVSTAGGSSGASLQLTTISGATGHTYSAIFAQADGNYLSSTSNSVATTGTGTATTLGLTVSPNPPVSGGATILTAVIAYTANGMTPTGTISYYQDGTLLGTSTVAGGTTYTYTSTAITGTTGHQFYAVYNGDTNFKTSTSPVVTTSSSTATVATTLSLNVSPNPPVSGSPTTLTATVGGTNATASTGTVTFYQDAVALGTGAVTSGVATYMSSALSSKTAHAFTASYAGDGTFKASSSGTVSTAATTVASPTTTALTVFPNPPVSGSTTALTATVTPTAGVATPTGSVMFYQDGVALTSSTLNSSGVATLSSTTFSSKTAHSFTATYLGDANNATSTSTAVATAATTQALVATTVTVTAPSSTATTGGTMLLTAVVTPATAVAGATPTGTATFSSSQGTLCTATIVSGGGGCTATFTTAGAQSISVSYSGDTNFAASTSTVPAAVTVSAPTGTLSLTITPSTGVMYGTNVVLTSNVTTASATGTTGPTGTVNIALAGTSAATYSQTLTPTSTTSAIGTTTIAAPTPGSYTATATCTSSTFNCTGVTASATLVTVKGNTTTTVVSAPTSPVAGQTTVLTITVAPAYTVNSSAVLPTGTVTLYINGTSTVIPLLNGSATYPVLLTATTGSYITAVYSGDTNWNGSTSQQLVVTIAPVPTTLSLSANETTALYEANIVLTATTQVAATTLTPYPTPPTGTVTFYDLYNGMPSLVGTTSLTPVVLGYSIGQVSTTGLLKGTHNITAVFIGGTAYAGSTASITINITDYGYTFSPSSLSVTRGGGGNAIATVISYNGFAGQVVLGCTPPPGSLMTCMFTPAVINGSGQSILSVTTTAPSASMEKPRFGAGSRISLAAVSGMTLFMGLMVPGRRRRISWMLALVAAAVLAGSVGCASLSSTANNSSSGGTKSTGTPQGTQLLIITTTGTDGQTTLHRDSNFPVTVQ